jgi:hypothetical protein
VFQLFEDGGFRLVEGLRDGALLDHLHGQHSARGDVANQLDQGRSAATQRPDLWNGLVFVKLVSDVHDGGGEHGGVADCGRLGERAGRS